MTESDTLLQTKESFFKRANSFHWWPSKLRPARTEHIHSGETEVPLAIPLVNREARVGLGHKHTECERAASASMARRLTINNTRTQAHYDTTNHQPHTHGSYTFTQEQVSIDTHLYLLIQNTGSVHKRTDIFLFVVAGYITLNMQLLGSAISAGVFW